MIEDPERRFIAVKKQNETYVVTYDRESVATVWEVVDRWASDPDLTFTYYDAALFTDRLRAAQAG